MVLNASRCKTATHRWCWFVWCCVAVACFPPSATVSPFGGTAGDCDCTGGRTESNEMLMMAHGEMTALTHISVIGRRWACWRKINLEWWLAAGNGLPSARINGSCPATCARSNRTKNNRNENPIIGENVSVKFFICYIRFLFGRINRLAKLFSFSAVAAAASSDQWNVTVL